MAEIDKTDDQERARAGANTPLAARLRGRIRSNGPITVHDYMLTCLLDPEHGYYRHRTVLGKGGDFVTAPEISQIFGELIGLWSAVVWTSLDRPPRIDLVELGPGNGTLLLDALRAAKVVPDFFAALSVTLVDVDGALSKERDQRLSAAGLQYGMQLSLADYATTRLSDAAPAIVIGNEFIDALPVRQYVYDSAQLYERLVDIDSNGAFRFVASRHQSDIPTTDWTALNDGDIIEICPGLEDIVATPLRHLAASAPLAALFIDYGHAISGGGDTLQAVRDHEAIGVFAAPGECDLTCHVDFARLRRLVEDTAGTGISLAVDGPLPQAAFLGALGITERASRLMAANPAHAAAIETGVHRLMSPTGMGSRFKAIGIRSPNVPPLPGLSQKA